MGSLGSLRKITDPRELYKAATVAMEEQQAVVETIALIRSRALAAMHAQGVTYKDLGQLVGLSTPRVGQLIGSNEAAVIEMFRAWSALERLLDQIATPEGTVPRNLSDVPGRAVAVLRDSGQVDQDTLRDIEFVYRIRNHLVHGFQPVDTDVIEEAIDRVIYLNARLIVLLHGRSARADELVTVAGIEIERRHDELAPRTTIRYLVAANPSTGRDQLWAALENKANRAYIFRGRILWSGQSYSDLATERLEPLGTTRWHIADTAQAHAQRVKIFYRSDEWDVPCPCSRPDDFGHWSESRKVTYPT